MIKIDKHNLAKELLNFIYESPSAFHAADSIVSVLKTKGFIELKEEDSWDIKPAGKYYITKNGSGVFAFIAGSKDVHNYGFRIIGAHTDSPTFKIKPSPDMISEGSYLKLNTEVYGGLIINTWLDRPLSLAGRVTLRGKDPFNHVNRLLNIRRPVLIIPNLAIHMNRSVNSGLELNKQKDILPLLGIINDKLEDNGYLYNLISKELKISKEDILDFELYLYEFEKGCIMGLNDEFISSSRLDDLTMVHAGLTALINSKHSSKTNILSCFDNEEVGSQTKQGAASPILSKLLERICLSFGLNREEFFRSVSRSFLISADSAHAVHPNYPEKSDPVLRPIINKGPVIKLSASQSYTSDAESSSTFMEICKSADVPFQKFVNRSDEKGGSTIGPIISSNLDIRSVDIGTPLLSMHSIRELGGVNDHYLVEKVFESFYSK